MSQSTLTETNKFGEVQYLFPILTECPPLQNQKARSGPSNGGNTCETGSAPKTKKSAMMESGK